MSELRQRIDEHKRRWRERIAKFRQDLRSDATRGVIAEALNLLWYYRRNPWESTGVCAALEFAGEEGFLDVFDGIWCQVEVRGKFKCATVEIPEELVGRNLLRVSG